MIGSLVDNTQLYIKKLEKNTLSGPTVISQNGDKNNLVLIAKFGSSDVYKAQCGNGLPWLISKGNIPVESKSSAAVDVSNLIGIVSPEKQSFKKQKSDTHSKINFGADVALGETLVAPGASGELKVKVTSLRTVVKLTSWDGCESGFFKNALVAKVYSNCDLSSLKTTGQTFFTSFGDEACMLLAQSNRELLMVPIRPFLIERRMMIVEGPKSWPESLQLDKISNKIRKKTR